MENFNKPLTVARQDFLEGLAKLINNCGLPFFVIEESLERLTKDVAALAKKQLENDRKAWEKHIAVSTENKDKNE